jgi:hypothetical protein
MDKGYTNDEGFCTQAGFYWYCDVHDTHGNADTADEAWHMADWHEEWWTTLAQESGQADADEGCDITVSDVTNGGLVERPPLVAR